MEILVIIIGILVDKIININWPVSLVTSSVYIIMIVNSHYYTIMINHHLISVKTTQYNWKIKFYLINIKYVSIN